MSRHRGSPRRAPEASPPIFNPSRQTRPALSLSATVTGKRTAHSRGCLFDRMDTRRVTTRDAGLQRSRQSGLAGKRRNAPGRSAVKEAAAGAVSNCGRGQLFFTSGAPPRRLCPLRMRAPFGGATYLALGHSLRYCALDRRGFDRFWVRTGLQHTIMSHEQLGIGINRQPVKQFP